MKIDISLDGYEGASALNALADAIRALGRAEHLRNDFICEDVKSEADEDCKDASTDLPKDVPHSIVLTRVAPGIWKRTQLADTEEPTGDLAPVGDVAPADEPALADEPATAQAELDKPTTRKRRTKAEMEAARAAEAVATPAPTLAPAPTPADSVANQAVSALFGSVAAPATAAPAPEVTTTNYQFAPLDQGEEFRRQGYLSQATDGATAAATRNEYLRLLSMHANTAWGRGMSDPAGYIQALRTAAGYTDDKTALDVSPQVQALHTVLMERDLVKWAK